MTLLITKDVELYHNRRLIVLLLWPTHKDHNSSIGRSATPIIASIIAVLEYYNSSLFVTVSLSINAVTDDWVNINPREIVTVSSWSLLCLATCISPFASPAVLLVLIAFVIGPHGASQPCRKTERQIKGYEQSPVAVQFNKQWISININSCQKTLPKVHRNLYMTKYFTSYTKMTEY